MNIPRLFNAVTQVSTSVAEPGFVGAPAALVPFVRLGWVSTGFLLLLLIRSAVAQPDYYIAFGRFDGVGGCREAPLFGIHQSSTPVIEPGSTALIGGPYANPADEVIGYGAGWASRDDLFISTRITGPRGPSGDCAHLKGRSRFEVTDLVFTSPSGITGSVPQVTFNPHVLKLEVRSMSSTGNQTWLISGGLTNNSIVVCGNCDLVEGPNRRFMDPLFTGPLGVVPATVPNVPLGTQFNFFMQLDTTIQVYVNAPPDPPVSAQARLVVDCTQPVFIFLSSSEGDFTADSDTAGIHNNRFTFSAPTIDSFTPAAGGPGTVVTINGSGFEVVTEVDFLDGSNNKVRADFRLIDSSHLQATVPPLTTVPGGTTTGPITVVTSCSSATSATSFAFTCPTITLSPSAIPSEETAGIAYSQFIYASGGTGPYTFTVSSGSLPNGLSLSPGGHLFELNAGMIPDEGDFTFTIKAEDQYSHCAGEKQYGICHPNITLGPLRQGTVNDLYNATITVTDGGQSPFTLTSNNLPDWLTLSEGVLSGTPTETGYFFLTILATDKNNCVGKKSYQLHIVCPTITVGPSSLEDGTVGQSYSQSITASGGSGQYTFGLGPNSSLPDWLNLSSDGVLSGTPTAGGRFVFRIRVRDKNTAGCYGDSTTYVVNIPCATITHFTPQEGAAGSVVTIYGSGLDSVTEVYFRKVYPSSPEWVGATNIQLVDAGQLRATVPTITSEGTSSLQIILITPCTGPTLSHFFFIHHKLPVLTINNPKIKEGNVGGRNLGFTVTVSPSPSEGQPVSVKLTTVGMAMACWTSHWGGTCTPLRTGAIPTNPCPSVTNTGDFVPRTAIISSFAFIAGTADSSAKFNVLVCGDTRPETNETVVVQMSQPTNAEFPLMSVHFGVGTIENDDPSMNPDR